MNNKMNWDHLRYFIEVVKAGTVVGAARELAVSHATVLRNIVRLEQSLGMRLFDRLQSGYQVTAEGEEILGNALAMEEQAQTLARRALGKHPAPEGVLSLAVSDTSLIDLMPLIREFRAEFPRIELRVGPARESAGGVMQLKADIAIVATNSPLESLVGRQLSRIAFACYASSHYLRERQKQSSNFDDYDWISWGLQASWQHGMLKRFSSKQKVALQTASHRDALDAVQAGVGVSLLSDRYKEELTRLPIKVSSETLGVWMLTHPELRRSGKVRAFMDFVAGWTENGKLLT